MAVNPDLAKERSKGTFNPDNLTCQIYGKEGMHGRRLARKCFVSTPPHIDKMTGSQQLLTAD